MKLCTSAAIGAVLLGTLPAPSLAQAKGELIRVAVYRGPASCEGCSETMKTSIEQLGPNYRVEFVGTGERTDISPQSLSRYDIYVQPGGGQDIPGALRSLGKARIGAIRNYVAQGGHYVGVCMGAYLADATGIGLIPHDLDSEVGRPGFAVKTIADAAITVRWAGQKQGIFFQDGPYLPSAKQDAGFRQIATYENGDVAAARYSFGKGSVVLSGPHPEADKVWFEEADIPLAKMPGGNLLRDLFSQARR
ncbi:BPL-N domain-containing protein [Labrys neptuniae]